MLKKKKNWGGHNKGRRHQAQAFTAEQVKAIQQALLRQGNGRDLALFHVALETMLRSSDLLRLRVGDVLAAQGRVCDCWTLKQQKTGRDVVVALSPASQEVLQNWLAETGKTRQDYLFSTRSGRPLTGEWFRILVKRWAALIGLDPSDYSGHSTRRTQAVHLYNQGMDVAKISKALGHGSLLATILYLGIEERDLIEALRKYKLKL